LSDLQTSSPSQSQLEQLIFSGSPAWQIIGELFPALKKYCPILPSLSKQQIFFLLLNVREAFYGGAAFGGKSAALLAGALQYVDQRSYASLLLRRTFPELEGPDGLIFQAHEWLGQTDAVWNEQKHRWTFPSGAVLQFGHVKEEHDKTNFQGQAYHYVGFDELTHFTETQYDYIAFSRARRSLAMKELGIPIRARSASNPGGIGHAWVKSRFIDSRKHDVIFVPAKLRDNPAGDTEDYEESLSMLGEALRKQLMEGDWGAFEGAAYTITPDHLVAPFEIPIHWERFESMDYGINNPTSWLVHAVDYEGNLISFGHHHAPGLVSETSPIIHKLRELWRSDFCWGDPASLATRSGNTMRSGEHATIQSEFADRGIPISKAKNDPRVGYTRMRELLKLDEGRRFPDWHPRASEYGSPRWFIVEAACPLLVEDMKNAPLAPIEHRFAGEMVDTKWEGHYGHAHAAARYGVASRFDPSEQPPDAVERTPLEQRADHWEHRLEKLQAQEEHDLMEV
jgi:hypothetical protein